MYASNSHSYTHLILALGIVIEPTLWGFITSQYHGIHYIGLPTNGPSQPPLRNSDMTRFVIFTRVSVQRNFSFQGFRPPPSILVF